MSTVYITGDTHGGFQRFTTKNFPYLKEMDREDCMVICGDFGGVWAGEQADGPMLDWLEDKPSTTLFVDGNHENFDLLNAYPEQEWHGGKVHLVRPNILHLMRDRSLASADSLGSPWAEPLPTTYGTESWTPLPRTSSGSIG